MLNRKSLTMQKNAVYSILHQLIMAVYGFGLIYILFHSTSREEAGRWILFASAISLADMLMHGFMQTPVIRLLSDKKRDSKEVKTITTNILLFSIFIWLLITSGILIAGQVIKTELTDDLKWYVILGALLIAYNTNWWIKHAYSDFKSIFIQRLIYCLASMGYLAFFLYHNKALTTEAVIISQIIGYTTSLIIIQLTGYGLRFSIKATEVYFLKYFFNYGKYTAGSMMMGSLLRNADIFMIAAFIGQGAVAIYSAAQKTIEIFEVALRGLAAHSLPAFCKMAVDPAMLLHKFKSTTIKLLLLFLPFSLLMFIFAEQVIELLSGSKEYSQAVIILRIFMAYVFFLVIDRMTGIILEALGMAKHNFAKMVFLVVVNISGNVIALYYFHSLAGVAIVSIFATATGIITGGFYLSKKFSSLSFEIPLNTSLKTASR